MGRIEDVGIPMSGQPTGSFPDPYQATNNNQYQATNNNQFQSPNGNQFRATLGNQFEAPTGNQFQAPTGNQFPAPIGNPWSTGLFDCHEDQTNAIMTTILPFMTFGQIAEVLDEGEMSCSLGSFMYVLMMPALFSSWILGSKYRAKLRKKYDLVEAPYEDAISHIFCPCCSLSQEFRELRNRGLNPALGWNGILAEQQRMKFADQQVHKPPPPFQAMSM